MSWRYHVSDDWSVCECVTADTNLGGVTSELTSGSRRKTSLKESKWLLDFMWRQQVDFKIPQCGSQHQQPANNTLCVRVRATQTCKTHNSLHQDTVCFESWSKHYITSTLEHNMRVRHVTHTFTDRQEKVLIDVIKTFTFRLLVTRVLAEGYAS